jgi:hypothetical protein
VHCFHFRSNIGGNSITSLTVTSTQYSFLRKLSSDSSLAITGSSCATGTATDVLDSVVCVSDDAASSSSDGSSSKALKHWSAPVTWTTRF